MSILNVNKINPVGGGSTVTIAGIASVTSSVIAPSFVGNVTGNADTASGLSGNPSINTTGIITATNVSIGSSVTAATFHGSGANLTGVNKNTNSLQVLEQFLSPCDASVISLNQGNLTLADVTDGQPMTSSYVDITGSEITYTPPTGTTQVIYEFQLHCASHDNHGIGTIRLYLDGVWVSDASFSWGASSHFDSRICYRWGFNIGGTQNNATGRRADWNSGRTIKLQGREYGNSNESKVQFTRYFDGAGTETFVRPCIGITALGSV